jgi:hypothetical protein
MDKCYCEDDLAENVKDGSPESVDQRAVSLAAVMNATVPEKGAPIDETSFLSDYLNRLWDAHLGIDNFYNEPKPAEELFTATSEMSEDSWSRVNVVRIINVPLICLIGNSYGYSTNAEPFLKKILEAVPQSIWKAYFENKGYEDTSLSSTLGSKNQESQWSKLMNEESDADQPKNRKYVTDELAANIKTVFKNVSRRFSQKFEEERNLWENLFKGY